MGEHDTCKVSSTKKQLNDVSGYNLLTPQHHSCIETNPKRLNQHEQENFAPEMIATSQPLTFFSMTQTPILILPPPPLPPLPSRFPIPSFTRRLPRKYEIMMGKGMFVSWTFCSSVLES
jgi:hypothetical protein